MPDSQPLLNQQQQPTRPSTFSIARSAYQTEGAAVFFRGIGICSARAFIVNAVQWGVSPSATISYQDYADPSLPTGLRVDHEKSQLEPSAVERVRVNTTTIDMRRCFAHNTYALPIHPYLHYTSNKQYQRRQRTNLRLAHLETFALGVDV
jgi:hypothetical protein